MRRLASSTSPRSCGLSLPLPTWTRGESPGDINRALADTLIAAQNEYQAEATVETDFGRLPPLLCVPGRLGRVFLNLIVDATHAIGEDQATERLLPRRVAMRRCGGDRDNQRQRRWIPVKSQHRCSAPCSPPNASLRPSVRGYRWPETSCLTRRTLNFETRPGEATEFVRLPLSGGGSLRPSLVSRVDLAKAGLGFRLVQQIRK